jgi:hypothetical protein
MEAMEASMRGAGPPPLEECSISVSFVPPIRAARGGLMEPLREVTTLSGEDSCPKLSIQKQRTLSTSWDKFSDRGGF